MEGRVFQRVLRVLRRYRDFRYLVRVFAIFNFAVTCHVAMSDPYLPTAPSEFINVSLYHLTVTRFAVLSAMIGRVMAASVQTGVFLRNAVNVQRHGLVREEITKRAHHFRRRFRVRRIIGSGQAFPAPFELPSAFRVPQLSGPNDQARTNERQLNDLRRRVFVEEHPYRSRTVPRATVCGGSSVVVPDRIFNFLCNVHVFNNRQRRHTITHRFVRVPSESKRGTTPPVHVAAVVSEAIYLGHRQVRTFPAHFSRASLVPCLYANGVSVLIGGAFFLYFENAYAE